MSIAEWYDHTTVPATGSSLSSATMRAEFAAVQDGISAKLPDLSGNGNKAVIINAGATALGVTTGTLALAGNFATSGANALTLTTTGATNVTLPTTGTLATLAGAETLSSKTINLASGAVGSPSLYLNSETTSGLYRIGANNHGYAISGAKVLDISSSGLAVTGTLSSTGTFTVGNGTGAAIGIANGGTSGATSGGAFYAQNGGVSIAAFGGYSAIVGGGYDSTATIYSNANLRFYTGAAVSATLDSSGNLGLGVTPSAWRANGKALQIGTTGFCSVFEQANGAANLSFNAFESGTNTFTYRATTYASTYSQLGGQHLWFTAPSGTAGNAISFTQAMTLDESGNLGLGVTPSASGSVYYRAFELGKAGCGLFAATAALTSSELVYFSGNAVLTYSGGALWLYGNNGPAATYAIEDGNHFWRNAASGTAGNAITFTQAMTLDAAGSLFINDTSNANSTIGLTINQGANDNQILAFKSSDVAHGITSIAETDTYGAFAKFDTVSGGLRIDGYSGATGGMLLLGIHTTDDTTKATNAQAAFDFRASLKSGSSNTDLGANANIVVFRNNATTRFILDADGDSHQDVGTAWTNFHGHDDHYMLSLLSAHVSRRDDPIRERFFGDFLKERRDVLERVGLATFNEDGHHFVNMSKLAMLNTGAILQAGDRIRTVESNVEHLIAENARISATLQRLENSHGTH